MQRKNLFWFLLYATLILFFVFLWALDFSLPDFKLHVSALNIGQGDALLITTPRGKRVLVDAGPFHNILEVLPGKLSYFENTIDLIVLTHAHSDHIAGFIPLLKRYHIPNVLLTGVDTEGEEYRAFSALLAGKNILLADKDHDIQLEPGVFLDILYPTDASLKNTSVKNNALNETSIIFQLRYGQTTFLFTGDAGQEEENRVLLTGSEVASHVLKAGHHGSKYSSSPAFLAQVRPEVALISAGKGNTYKHPSFETLTRLKEQDVQIYRTDEQGTIDFTCGLRNDCTVEWESHPREFENTRKITDREN